MNRESSRSMVALLWWAVVWLLLPGRLLALDLTPETSEVSLGHVIQIYRDPSHRLTVDEVRHLPESGFFKSDKRVPAFGFDPSTFWARFPVKTTASVAERWMLEFAYAPVQDIRVYMIAPDGATLALRSGTHVPVPERPWRHHNHVFPLVLQPDKTYDVYVSIAGETSKSFPLTLSRHDLFMEDSQYGYMLFGAIFGIGFAFVLYNALIWLTVREGAYLYYVLFTLSVGGFVATITGYLQLLLMPDSTFMAPALLPVCLYLTVATGFKSIRVFLGDELIGVRLVTLLKYISHVSVALAFSVFLIDYSHVIRIGAALCGIMPVLAIVILIRQWRRGSRFARYHLAAWGVLLFGAILTALRSFGVLPSNRLTENALYIGWSVMSILMSLGLAARMRDLKDENTAAIAQLVRNEKLASIGMMSAGVAHEINNPNNVIRLSIQQLTVKLAEAREFLLGLLEDDDDDMRSEITTRFDAMRQQAGLVSQGSERIGDIVNSMRSSSRKDKTEAVVFDPVQGVLDTLTLVKVNWGRKIEFVDELMPGCMVSGHPSELKQVFMNLLVNGCQAIEDRQKNSRGHPGEMVLISTVVENELHLVFQDNGCGMSESVRQRLFQPFFTTKGEERGTGLGVSICRRIVESHGGRLEVHSVEGEGSVFTVALPLRSTT